jgi:hypothetical protein
MAKTKVSLTLDADAIEALAELTGSSSLSAAVTDAVAEKLRRIRKRLVIEEIVREWEAEHGEIPDEMVERWDKVWRQLGV